MSRGYAEDGAAAVPREGSSPQPQGGLAMQRRTLLGSAAGLALVLGVALPAAAETTLNVITAGSENMVD